MTPLHFLAQCDRRTFEAEHIRGWRLAETGEPPPQFSPSSRSLLDGYWSFKVRQRGYHPPCGELATLAMFDAAGKR